MRTVKALGKTLRVAGGRRAFTFIEILFSMTLSAIVILSFTVHTVGVMKGNHSSSNFTAATNLAQDKIEQIKAQTTWDNVNYCPDSGGPALTATGMPGGNYRRCWVVKDSPFGDGLKQVDVTVSWRDSSSHAVTLSTLVFSR